MAERDLRVLRHYILPQATDITSLIVSLAVEANNFELWLALISFMEKDSFGGRLTESTHIHLGNFLAKCDTIKLNRFYADAIRLRLFPFSQIDRAND